jgi:hypothetical protein
MIFTWEPSRLRAGWFGRHLTRYEWNKTCECFRAFSSTVYTNTYLQSQLLYDTVLMFLSILILINFQSFLHERSAIAALYQSASKTWDNNKELGAGQAERNTTGKKECSERRAEQNTRSTSMVRRCFGYCVMWINLSVFLEASLRCYRWLTPPLRDLYG